MKNTIKANNEIPNHNLEINKMLTLSTCHITEETNNRMLDLSPEEILDLFPIIVYPKDGYGYFVVVPFENEENSRRVPQDLKDIIKFAKANSCEWVMLDSDGLANEYLPSYNW